MTKCETEGCENPVTHGDLTDGYCNECYEAGVDPESDEYGFFMGATDAVEFEPEEVCLRCPKCDAEFTVETSHDRGDIPEFVECEKCKAKVFLTACEQDDGIWFPEVYEPADAPLECSVCHAEFTVKTSRDKADIPESVKCPKCRKPTPLVAVYDEDEAEWVPVRR